MRKIISAIIVFLCLGLSAIYAQESGGYAGSILRYGVGGRAMGMGRAFTALSDDASGVYWNPAGIVGASRIELTSMYSNLYYDSQYSHVGFIWPRPIKYSKNVLLRFLLGSSSAIGFSWVGLSNGGFEQRTATAEYLGQFDIEENGFMVSWARENMSSWGTFRYGATVKFMKQSFSGLQSNESANYDGMDGKWSTGMDVGFTYQPLHAPLFNKFSLRSVLPLRLGFTVQNLIQPYWAGQGDHKDLFPRIYRWGISYLIYPNDWIPETWYPVRSFFEGIRIRTAFDQVFYKNKHRGIFFGAEFLIPLTGTGIMLTPRFGLNDRSDGTSFGVGLTLPFTGNASIRIDYAYSMHEFLADDSRFFMTIQVGGKKNSAYFRSLSARENISEKEYKHHLYRILSAYPDADGELRPVLNELKEIDAERKSRYLALLEGLELAEYLYDLVMETRENGEDARARPSARDADAYYKKAYRKDPLEFRDQDFTHWGETQLFLGMVEEAREKLFAVKYPDLRTEYMIGVAWKAASKYDSAIVRIDSTDIRRSREIPELKASIVALIFLHNAECLYRLGEYDEALVHLNLMTTIKEYTDFEYSRNLNRHYPRFPAIGDENIVDDAQVLKALCLLRMAETVSARNVRFSRYKEGVLQLFNTFRFFPYLEYGFSVGEQAEQFVEALREENEGQLRMLTDQMENSFLRQHTWPLE